MNTTEQSPVVLTYICDGCHEPIEDKPVRWCGHTIHGRIECLEAVAKEEYGNYISSN